MAEIGIVDAWAQMPVRGDQLVPEVRRLLERSGTAQVLQTGVDVAETIAAMDGAGHPMVAVRELERAVSELGLRALRVIPWLWDRPPDDRLYYPHYARCVELGIPFCTQIGHTGPAMPSEPGRPIPYLDRVALDFPELVIVAGHLGHPWTEEAIGLAWKHDNLYLDTSAHAPRYYPEAILRFIATYGSEKVLFGTNYPQLPLERCAAEARALNLPDEARQRFLRTNALHVFGVS